MNNKKLIGSLMLLFAAMLWGGSYGMQSILSNSFGTYAIIFIKTVSGFLLLGLCALQKKKFDKTVILSGILVGVVGGIGLILQQIGIENTSVSKASFLSGLYVMFVPIIGLFTKKKPKKKYWLAIGVAFVGLYLLCMSGDEKIGYGDIVTLFAAIFFALQIVLIDKYVSLVDPLLFCGFQQSTVAVMSGIMMLLFETPDFSNATSMIGPMLYVSLLSGLLGQALQNKYQAYVDPTVASLIMSLESVFGTLGGWLLLNQTLTTNEIIGCVLLFASIIIAE